ncbi:hypothetical protein FE257_001965 [Aspergillus nanangensis]|uniref:AB hydrolase-1 domain-containing protein n=1 Tax=Aspergillus nanangensis TaxID=2582783 RepID=A0AAD4GQC0_ASPNN|nr:hypothetical protein FE257_001965 [Aspergillus nanangensis]
MIMASEQMEFFDLGTFTFQDGTSLPNVRLAYRVFNPTASKLAVIPTCFRGRINSTLNFADGALADHRVVVVALFGNGESSSPSNTLGFPQAIDYRDCVRAQYKLMVEHLQALAIDVMVGFSMGGQCTYHWTVMYPDLIRNAVIICSSARTSRHNYQFLEGPKAALENSLDYMDGAYRAHGVKPRRGLRAFGKAYSAWLTSASWFEERRFQELGHATLQEWDDEVTMQRYEDWDAEDLLAMLRMWQKSDIGVCKDDTFEDAMASIKARVLLMPCRTDQYFHWQVSEKEGQMLADAQLQVIPSVWGHLAGAGANTKDVDWMNGVIGGFLEATD